MLLSKLPRCKQIAALAAAILLCILLTGCDSGGKTNTLTPVTLTAEDTSILSTDPSDVFRQNFRLDRKLKQLRLYVEVWQNGEVINRAFFQELQGANSAIAVPERESYLDLTHQVNGLNPGDPWKQVAFQAAIGQTALTELVLDLPAQPPLGSVGTSWLGGSSEEKSWPIVSGESIIIMYLPFSVPDQEPLNVYDCSYLMEHPQELEQYAYALVVRAEFSPAEEEDDAESDPALDDSPAPFLSLDEAVDDAILKKGFDSITIEEGTLVTAAHEILLLEEDAQTATVYAAATKLTFNVRGGMTLAGGGYKPVRIVFTKDSAGRYTLSEYRQPKDGDGYEEEVRSLFPAEVVKQALDIDSYLISLSQTCYAQALSESGYDPTDEITRMIDLIAAKPEDSDVLDDHIHLRRYDYNQLLILNEHTLRYVFGQFLKEPQPGVRGELMAKLMSDLLGSESIGTDYQDGQAYFERWKSHVLSLRNQHMPDFFKTGAPKAYMLLEMLGKA